TNGTLTLSQLTGLSFSTGDGTSDATMTFSGTLASINAALAGMSFTPVTNYNGAAQLQITTSDLGNSGAGGALSDADTVNITVNAVNDAPVNNVPGPQSTNEDTTLVFSSGNGNAFSIADVDSASATVKVTLTATNGLLTLSQLTGLSFITGDGIADGTIVFTGTVASINAALNGLSYAPSANYNGSASISITTDDQGNTGSGGNLSDSSTISITVNAVNDAPVNNVPGAQMIDEDNALIFSSGNGNRIFVSDLDVASGNLTVTLSASHGVLTLSQLTGLLFSTGDGSGDAVMTFSGTVAAINAALDGLTFLPNLNYNGPASVSITSDDGGNTGSGGNLSDTDTVNITVKAVNDAPVNNVPGPQVTDEDTTLVFSSGNGNAISILDVDAGEGTGIVQVTLTSTHGALSLSQVIGLSFATGDGSADYSMTFTGTIAAINAALNGLSFAPDADYNGPASITLTTNDQANTGSGGTLTDTSTINITVDAINDAPTLVTTGGTSSFTENGGPIIVDAVIVVDDIDNATLSGAVAQIVGYVPGEDVLGFTNQNGIVGLWDSITGTLTLLGSASVSDYQQALRSITYNNTSEAPSAAARTIRFTVNDGALDSATADKSVSVTAINDAPVITTPAAQVTDEDVTLVFSSGNGNAISLGDVDALSNDLQVTLSVSQGLLTLASTTGLGFITGDGTNDATMTFTGTLAQINAALNGLSYLGSANYNGADALNISVNDLGHNGNGGALTDSASVPITVQAVNDAPVNSVPGPQSTNEDTPLILSSGNGNLISITDLDVAGGIMKITLSVTSGRLTLGTIAGLSFSTGDGIADGTMTFTGDIVSINTALDGLIYDPPADFNGVATITLVTDDQANVGQGGALIDSSTIDVTVNAVNDAPVITIPRDQGTDEDTDLVFSSGKGNAISVNDVDLLGGMIRITLSATNGVLTLSQLNGLGFSVGDGAGDANMTFEGTLADVNAALDGLIFSPDLNYNGPASVSIVADDKGQSGTGGTLTDSATVDIDVDPVNDGPVNSVPGAQVTNEDTPFVFSGGNGNLIWIADLDAASGRLQVTLSVLHGTLTLADLTGLSFITGDGITDGSMTFTGTVAQINGALDGLLYSPSANYNGNDTLTITTNDQANTGKGGSLADTDTVPITIKAVNDAPVIAVPPSQVVNEDTSIIFSSGRGNAISIADLDVAAGMLQVTLSVAHGTLSLASLNGLSFILGDGTGNSAMTFLGTLADINAALDGLAYHPGADYFGADTLSIAVDDEGNTGIGGTLTDSKTVNITVNAVNDEPVITPGGNGITYTENDPKTPIDPAISLIDVDNGTLSGAVIRILNHVAGQDLLSFVNQNGITGVWNPATGTLTLSGVATVAEYELALRSIAYSNTSEDPHTTPRVIRFTVSDGTADSAPVSYTVSIVSVNDRPNGKTVPDVKAAEDSEAIGIALWKFFSDAEDADSDLVLSLTGNTNASLFSSVSIDPATGRLVMDFAPNANGDSTMRVRATDRGGKFVEILINVQLDPVNDAPTLSTTPGTIKYTASDNKLPIDTDITLGDIDSGTLNGATIRMLDYYAGEDQLSFAPLNGISGSWDAKTGTLTLTGSAPLADYQYALRTVTYKNLSANSRPGTRVLELAVNDGGLSSNLGMRTIDVVEIAQVLPPVVIPPPPPAPPPPPFDNPVPLPKPEPKPERTPVVIPQPTTFHPTPTPKPEPAPEPVPPPAPVPPAPAPQPEQKPEPKPAAPVAPAPVAKPPDPPAPIPIDPPAVPTVKAPHYQTAELWRQLDTLSRQITDEGKQGPLSVGAVTGLTTTLLSVGYVIWCLRGGTMMATLLTTLPLWRFMDPLPVLEIYEKERKKDKENSDDDEDEERLRSMMD
ncbi:MAG TPA: hypothetical protein VF669_03185, partial [Tepidisphaeraceae bacterium]